MMEIPDESAPLLLRVWRRRCSLEEEPAVLQEAEFELGDGRPDLRPSVYEIHSADVVRTVTEHYASAGCDKVTAPKKHPDLSGVHTGSIEKTPCGTDWFSFVNAQHRELVLESMDELMKLVRQIRDCRSYDVEKHDWQSYVRSCRDDAEWRKFFQFAERGHKWKKIAERTS